MKHVYQTLGTLFVLWLHGHAMAQVPGAAEDAIKLRKQLVTAAGITTLDKKTLAEWGPILNRHLGADKMELINGADLSTQYNENPYLKGKIPANATMGASTGIASDISMLMNPGSIPITNLADGIAQFLVDRTKEELGTFFFQKFKAKITTTTELQVLFPDTYKVLQVIGNEIYHYSAYIGSLRQAFEKDFSNLLVSFPKLMDTPKYEKIFNHKSMEEVRLLLKVGFYIAESITQGDHPGSILAHFPSTFGSDTLPANLFNSIRIAQVFSASLQDIDSEENYWLSADSAMIVVQNDIVFQLYLALMYQSCPADIEVGPKHDKTSLRHLLKLGIQYTDSLREYQLYYRKLVSNCSRLQTQLKTLQTKMHKKEDLTHQDYADLFRHSLDFLDFAFHAKNLPCLPAIPTKTENKVNSYFYVAGLGVEVYEAVSANNYSSAIINVVMMADTIFNTDIQLGGIASENRILRTELSKLPKRSNKSDLKSHIKGNIADSATLAEGGNVGGFSDELLKYGSFMASLIKAKTSEDVLDAIEAAALPPGNSIVKKTTAANVSVNAYLGGGYGREFLGDAVTNNDNSTGWANVGYITAPIGIALSRGIKSLASSKVPVSTSLFVSLVDVGAIATYRFQDDSTAALPDLTFRNIFTPGAYFVVGVSKAPVSIGFGGQMGPALRQIDAQSATISDGVNWRWGAFIAIDIPVFNLYTKGLRD